jgi:hypothetical protein
MRPQTVVSRLATNHSLSGQSRPPASISMATMKWKSFGANCAEPCSRLQQCRRRCNHLGRYTSLPVASKPPSLIRRSQGSESEPQHLLTGAVLQPGGIDPRPRRSQTERVGYPEANSNWDASMTFGRCGPITIVMTGDPSILIP